MAYSRGKWTKHKIVAGSKELLSSLPPTRSMSRTAFLSLLDKYGKVIVKPSSGWGGAGVIQVSAIGKGKYEVHYGQNKRIVNGRDSAYSFVHSKTKSRSHIVQKRIPLARVNGRPFDLRVMVQKTRKTPWTVTGKLAKIAGSGYIVTNIARSKGRVVPVSTAIAKSTIHGASSKQILSRIDSISLKTVKRLHSYYRWIDTVGLDIGLDSKGKVWIIEANFNPAKSLFLRLKDKSSYSRIMSFARKRV